MGLRHRTAVCILRMQRQNAEASSQRVQGKPALRKARNIYFSHIDPTDTSHSNGFKTPPNRQQQEDSARLLQRLRQALHPLNEDQFQASKEYESLQDEILRLSQHIAQQKSRTSSSVWDESQAPYRYELDQGPDSLPYRTIKIVADETRSIERLDLTPADLSQYRQPIQAPSTPNRSLTLVAPQPAPTVDAPKLLIHAEAQHGDATANLTQQSLNSRGPRSTQISIRPEVALSLLDS